MRVADVIAHRLHTAGCRHVFGVPGGEVATLIDAFEQTGLDVVTVRHENAGGFMAEGTHHVTKAPGVLLATLGPGITNAVNVVANAWLDGVPLVAICGSIEAAKGRGYTHQIIDHCALFEPITKGTFAITADDVDATINDAITLAMNFPAGPVLIELGATTADIVVDDDDDDDARQHAQATSPTASSPTSAPHDNPDTENLSLRLEHARAALADAERPLIIVGMHGLDTGEALLEFIEKQRVPVMTTYKAKGVLAESHPLALGGVGLSPRADEQVLPLVRDADVVILVGYDPVEMRTGWCRPFGPQAEIIDITPGRLDHDVHRATLTLTADPSKGLLALNVDPPRSERWPDRRPSRVRAALTAMFAANREEWGPAAVFEIVHDVLPGDGILTVDTGAHRILLNQQWSCARPRTLLQSMGLCTMGCAVPLAAGVKLADPTRPVVALSGDGGMAMILGELATLADRDIALPIVVIDDSSLALIEMKQRSRGLSGDTSDLGATDFAAVGNALGGKGIRITDAAALEDELGRALTSSGFTLLHCAIGRRMYDGRF